jgi:hypothetical protein
MDLLARSDSHIVARGRVKLDQGLGGDVGDSQIARLDRGIRRPPVVEADQRL